jgi:hypothetical protein
VRKQLTYTKTKQNVKKKAKNEGFEQYVIKNNKVLNIR